MHHLSAFCTLVLLSVNLFAQQNYPYVHDQIQLKERDETNSLFHVQELSGTFTNKYINTVVHVVYFEGADSIPIETIETVIEDLNRLFRAEEIDTSLISPIHLNKLTDSQIQFCLATTDPNGEQTKGITYTQTEVDGFPLQSSDGLTAELVKDEFNGGAAPWDIDRYLNIWIAQIGQEGNNFSYAIPREEFFPFNAFTPANTTPGVVIDVDNFIATPQIGTLEGLFAHECGHALGLLHTFQFDGINASNFCDGTDFIDDTPTAAITFECDPSLVVNTCTDSLNDEPDNVSNIMNYACQLMFTPNQIATMHNNLSQAPSGLFKNTPCGVTTSVENPDMKNRFNLSILPNPNNGNFTLTFQKPNFSKAILSIYNSVGQSIFEKDIDLNHSLSFPIHIYEIKKGIYYLRVKSRQGIFSKRILVQGN